MQERARGAAEIARQKDLLGVTLSSIGDGVIVTDMRGTVTFMNAVAETLTGWTLAEAVGRDCAEIFRIENESTRAPVESPVSKVLATGQIAGLANHTLLVRRDGTEIAIDDSGAPIREPDGEARGVVLVFRDVSEAKAAEKSLRAAKEAAERANAAKDRFVAVLSHELRTPLSPVLVLLSSWRSDARFPTALRRDLEVGLRNLALEVRLIDDLLDMSRITSGKLALAPAVVDAHELLRAVVALLETDAHDKNLRVTLDLDAAAHFLRADPARVLQVFWNVMRNAAKFSPPGGEIRVATANTLTGDLRVTVSDDGIGIAPEMLARVFEPFEQGSHDVVRDGGGLGLGMAISKALVDAHGGTIAAASDGPGKGARFTIELATCDSPPPAAAGEIARPMHVRALRILLVEDHDDSAQVMRRLLERLGHTVTVRGDVAGALAAVEERDFDLLLSDLGLPDGSGLDLLRQVRSGGTQPALPALALTGYGMEADVRAALAAGFSAHLTKPVDFARLETEVARIASAELPGESDAPSGTP